MNEQRRNPGTSICLKGEPLSSGLSRGRAYVYTDVLQHRPASYNIRKDQFDDEYQRIRNAKENVRRQLFDSAKRIRSTLNRDVADIFLAQETMLIDPQLMTDLRQTLRQKHVNAEEVIGTVFRRWIRKFRDAPSQILNQRADDIEDLYRRMLGVLGGVDIHRLEKLPWNTILVAHRLLPSDTVFLSRESCAAILLEVASPTAHATILAREMGIPCVGQVPRLLVCIDTGSEVLVDGNTGTVTVDPDESAVEVFNDARNRFVHRSASAMGKRFKPAVTARSRRITVMANVGSRDDVEKAAESGAEGIGLFRTEGFFLAAKTMPSSAEFAQYLMHCLEPAEDKVTNVRLLDIGGDKNIPYLSLPFEPNPFLGRRGIRMLFDFPALLHLQLEAILMVSRHRRIQVLIPMVTFTEEIVRIRQALEKLAAKKRMAPPPVGAMVETPAAALAVSSLRKQAHFLGIGTNDLTQYVMAADRESALVRDYFNESHPVMIELLRSIVVHAGKTPITLCGELAVKRDSLARVLKTGITALSIAPNSIPAIKEAIRHIDM